MAHLVIRESPDGARKGKVVQLGDARLLIGRGADCDLAIADEALSRRHAELSRQAGACVIRDVGSINGTQLNGTRLSAPRQLRHGDLVTIGFTTLLFEDPDAVAAGPTLMSSRQPALDTPRHAPPVAQPALRLPPAPPSPAVASAPVLAASAPPSAEGGQLRPNAAQREGGSSFRNAFACCGCFVLTLALAGVGGAVWWKFGDRIMQTAGGGGAAEPEMRSEPSLVATDFGIPPAPAIEVKRGAALASTQVTTKSGGSLATGDGLSITIPPGAFAADRNIRVFAAAVPPPPENVALIGEGSAKLSALKAWDIDAGPDEGLFDGEVEVKVRCDKGQIPLYAAISVDGKRWTKVPATIDGESVTFRTRHFSPVSIVGLSQAAMVVLPIAAVTYLVIERAEELPSKFHADAPFVSVDVNPPGFEIYWSRKLKGVDPATGFRDEKGYKAELEKVVKEYKPIGGGGTTGAASFNAEVAELKRKHLMPDSVREIEAALVHAQGYLESRKIDRPALSLPVYVVPSLGDAAGQVNNPWSGRRYMLMGGDSTRGAVWTTALHELFHHYQMGYVWIDRTSHLPFVEASALLMEREAMADYLASGKPFDIAEGVALSQMVAYRNGFDGPGKWEEAYVRRHGYGMTWFLEYLRDERYVGTLKKNDPRAFHAELLKQWRSRWTGAMERGLKWAADGDESLGRAWIDFAQNYVLKGPVDACGNRTPYGARYNGCPLSDSPYANQALEYGLPASRIDLKNAAVKPLGDEDIAKWSIQFYEILPPARPKVSVVVRTPRTWFPAKGKSRAVFVRPDAKAEVVAMKAVDAAPLSSPSAYAVLPTAGTPVYAYVVDTGQTGSGWVYSNDEAAIFVLEPPQNVKSELQGNRQKITWTEPPVAATKEVLSGYRIYETGGMSPLGFVKAGTASFDFEIEGSAKAIELTSAIEVGKAEDGALLYIESERSDPVGSAGAGNYEMCLDLTSEILKVGDSCDSMFPDWQFPSMQPCFDVAVGPDGRFNFHHEWKGKFREGQTHLLDGEGSFVGSVLRIKGTFRNDASWTNGLSKFEQTDSGPFSGEGKYIGDVWFGTKLEGTFESSITRHFCKNSNEGCTEWEDKSLSCSGKIPSYVSSIPKFERK